VPRFQPEVAKKTLRLKPFVKNYSVNEIAEYLTCKELVSKSQFFSLLKLSLLGISTTNLQRGLFNVWKAAKKHPRSVGSLVQRVVSASRSTSLPGEFSEYFSDVFKRVY
jgi:hypothetical protein